MQYNIVFEKGLQPAPQPHELRVARIMAECYDTDVLMMRRGIFHSADVKIRNVIWEIKSPIGNSAKTIENNLREASKQSENVIIDLSRTKMSVGQTISRAKYYVEKEKNRHIKKILVVTKHEKVIDIFGNAGYNGK